jgi:tetratricopeptide (TPR) repeat protein
MKSLVALLSIPFLLAGCATPPPPLTAQDAEPLLQDGHFAAPARTIAAEEVFALSPRMKRYIEADMAPHLRAQGHREGLIDALYSRSRLKLRYDSARTRNAAEAFDGRAGNCLSLVIMTAAFAKALEIPVHYQSVMVDAEWSRSGNLYLTSGHVNIALGQRLIDRAGVVTSAPELLTVDFLPSEDTGGRRTQAISESTVVAMYMNNRAVESLTAGEIDDAYWFVREAVLKEPRFLAAFNTLGVVYLRRGLVREAEPVFARVLQIEPENRHALANMARLLAGEGRQAEAEALQHRLAQIEPYPPYHFFDLGVAAMKEGRFADAKALFTREIRRAAYQHEFHFWLGVANYKLGDTRQASKHIAQAVDNSTTQEYHDLYAAKLQWLKAQQQRQRLQ